MKLSLKKTLVYYFALSSFLPKTLFGWNHKRLYDS